MGPSKIILTLGAIALFSSAAAQDELGLRTSNFAGVNRLTLNPAAAVGAPTKWSVNIIGAGVFVNNRYAYLENTSGINALKNINAIQMSPTLNDGETSADGLNYNFYDAQKKMDNSVNAFAALPSFVFQKDGRSFGLLLNARAAFSANRIDPDLDYFSITTWDFAESKNIGKVRTAGMSWAEVGLHYGQNLLATKNGQLNIGGTLKYLLGTDAYFVKSTNLSDVTKFSDSLLVSNSAVKYGIATGLENDLSTYNFQVNGHGVGLDLGLEYKISSENKNKPYNWKFGVSVSDLGFIHFGKNAQKHNIEVQETFDLLTASYEDIASIEDIYAINSTEVLNDPLQSKVADKFNISTPAGISLQVDYAITEMLYVNATLNRRLRFAGPQVERENFLAITPRIEHKWFEFGMPLVLYDDIEPRLGAWVRLGYLTIGSDNFSSLVMKQDKLHGTDIYMSLNLLGYGRSNKSGKNKNPKLGSEYGCYF